MALSTKNIVLMLCMLVFAFLGNLNLAGAAAIPAVGLALDITSPLSSGNGFMKSESPAGR